MPRVSFQPLGDSWALVLVLLAALAAGLFLFAANDKGVSRARRRFELGLRMASVLLFAILFTRPALVTTVKEELPASVAFLCDVSESMAIRDGENSESRYETMRRTLDAAGDKLRALCEKFDVYAVGFGQGSDPIPVEDGKFILPDAPTGSETRLGDALAETLRSTAGKRLLGVVTLSDGAQRARDADAAAPQDVALRLRDAERPVYAVPFGSDDVAASIRDVAVEDLRANDHVFLGNELTVSGQVRVLGCANAAIPLTLALETSPGKMETVAQTVLEPKSNNETLSYQFVCKPETAGEWKLSVAAQVQENELTEANNELGAFVEALDRGTDVLYIEGTRRYEQNFIRAALETAPDVRLRYWRPSTASMVAKLPNKTEAEMLAEYTKSRKSAETAFFGEGKFAAYVLGDVDATAFQPNELKELAKRVEEGAGLVVLAGERSLGLGGYAKSPLAELLPVQTLESERLPLESELAELDAGAAPNQRARFDGAFSAEPSQGEGKDDFIIRMSLDVKKNAAIWSDMPALASLYRLGRVKPNATVLLTARPVDASGKPDAKAAPAPLLVTQRYGAGRVAVLATDSTWRWRMRGKETEHAKFWRQLLLWTSKFDELLEGELAVELDRARYDAGEQVSFHAVYRPKPNEDTSGMTAAAEIVAPDGTRERVDLTDEQGIWRGLARKTSAPGDYLVEARLLSPTGETLQTARARFLVADGNLELERPEANPATMTNLAATTGGKSVPPEEFESLLDELLQKRDTVADYREVKKTLYDTWLIFALFVAIMTLDWILRKRWGLV